MKRYLPALALLLLAGCDTPHSSTDLTHTPTTVPDNVGERLASERTCYAGTLHGDTVTLTLIPQDTAVSGSLTLIPKEKDRSKGGLSGRMLGDTLIADYTFDAEGTESIREVAWLLRGDSAVEGYGPMKPGGTRFVSRAGIRFGQGYRAVKIPCKGED